MIYADHAATTPLDTDAKKIWVDLQEEYGNSSQPYSFSRRPKEILDLCRKSIAKCIGSKPNEIIFTSGGSESNNMAIIGTMLPNASSNSMATSPIEHHSILKTVAYVKQFGASADYFEVSKDGTVLLESFTNLSKKKLHLVSLMLANNEIGTIQPISSFTKINSSRNVIFHTDAVQAIGHISVNVNDLGVDLLSASAHKFNGPKGIGFLYVREGTPIHSLINGGKQEYNLRAGTENIPSIAAMCVALNNNLSSLNKTTSTLVAYEKTLIDILNDSNIDYIRNGSKYHVPGNINLSFRNISGESLLHRLDLMGIMVSTGSACDGSSVQHSHVLKSIGVNSEYIGGTIRISLGKDNTLSDVQIIAESICKIVKKNK